MRARLAVVFASTLALLGAGLFALAPGGAVTAQAPAVARRYALHWHATERREGVSLGDGSVASTLSLTGKLVLQDDGEGAWVGHLDEVQGFSLSLLGKELPVDVALLKAPFRAEREAGRIVRVQLAEGTEPLVEHVLRALLQELNTPASGTRDTSRLGEVDIELTPGAGGALVRRRVAYRPSVQLQGLELEAQRVTSLATLRFEGGWLTRLQTQERLELPGALFEDALTLEETSREPAVAVRVAWAPARAGGDVSPRTGLDRSLLEQRAEGLSAKQLVDDVRTLGNGGRMPNHDRWLWTAVGRLRLEPEQARELEREFLDGAANVTRRLLIMDLLASAGTKQAQEAMLRLLDGDVVRGMPEAVLLQQRLSFVTSPEPATVRWLEARFSATKGVERSAAAASLGAAAGHLQAKGDAAEARRLNGELTSALAAAKDPKEREAVLDALGNAGLAENRPVLERALSSDVRNERRSALLALRKDESAEATSLIIRAAAEADLAADAVTMLTQRELSAPERSRVFEQLRGGAGLQADLAALPLLGRSVGTEPQVRELLLLIAARHPEDASLREQVFTVLADAEDRLAQAP